MNRQHFQSNTSDRERKDGVEPRLASENWNDASQSQWADVGKGGT